MIRKDLKNLFKEIFPEEEIFIDYVPKGKQGDYSTNLAFKIAAKTGEKSLKVAQAIAAKIKSPMIAEIIVYPPGFINFVISNEYLLKNLTLKNLKIASDRKTKILVEFVSVNPTGPINIVNARAAAIGDTLVRLFNFIGNGAKSEFYVCDTGVQVDILGKSLLARIKQLKGSVYEIPEGGYAGEYLVPIAEDFVAAGLKEELNIISNYAVKQLVEQQKKTLERFGVTFDRWYFEHEIYENQLAEKVFNILKSKGLVFEKDDALWFRATEFGDIRDRVIQTRDKRYTYLLPDIGYHLDKFNRGFDRLLDLFGPDHQGHVPSLKSGVRAIGFPAEQLDVLIVQQVNLIKGEKHWAMSKRDGVFITLDELMAKVPVDVIRFFFLTRAPSQPLDFDLELALKETEENPVYYVQYAYARIKSIINFAQEKGIEDTNNADLSMLKEKEEFALIKQLLKFPEIVEDTVQNLTPHPLSYYLIDLARVFHFFYQQHRVVGEDLSLTPARLFLVSKTAETIKKGLELLGVSSPERM